MVGKGNKNIYQNDNRTIKRDKDFDEVSIAKETLLCYNQLHSVVNRIVVGPSPTRGSEESP